MSIELNFVEGEKKLGRYTISLLQETDAGWLPTVLQFDATITNYRLFLRPFKRKYQPASIPASYIRAIKMTQFEGFHVVQLNFNPTGIIYMVMSSGKLDNLYDDLSAMKAPIPKFGWDVNVARDDIQRLINFFGRDALADSVK
jgi:hypothetical protein